MMRMVYLKFIKRILDIFLSLSFIVLTLPILLLIILVLAISQKKIFFLQKRPGFQGQLFTVFKFRTMNEEKDQNGDLLREEERITTFGRFLRKTNLDELPQLFNVLLGSMSIVGPRPFLKEYLNLYSSEQAKRHFVKPGITGWAQINGGNNISWQQKLYYDLEYVEQVNFAFDLKIILITFSKIVTLKGFNTGTFIPEKFKGQP
jgi:undecaprenyl phosphate N,N'-diacetylbacillosamine 1-phosphate transferase